LVILGSLGYLILPFDVIPDPMPGVGFGDDLGAIALAFTIVAIHIKDEHKEQARATLRRFFGAEDGPPEPHD
jgi:uncharacterized membrane protein YkvA (DUF1232 family)